MGIGRRLLDLARANLNALLDRAAGRDMSDEELDHELDRRKRMREREDAERAARNQAEERARKSAEAAGRKREAKRPPPRSTPPGDKRLRDLYAQLETPYGASLDEVKKSFRRLMRKYHPDLHVKDPKKHKAATQLTMELTSAMSELEQLLAR
jgi:DnaJ-domain-containing protein 1